jgi:hypothetical protein
VLEAPTPGSVQGEGDAPVVARPTEYSDELRERAVRLCFESVGDKIASRFRRASLRFAKWPVVLLPPLLKRMMLSGSDTAWPRGPRLSDQRTLVTIGRRGQRPSSLAPNTAFTVQGGVDLNPDSVCTIYGGLDLRHSVWPPAALLLPVSTHGEMT